MNAETRITFTPNALTDGQRCGLNCVVCGRGTGLMRPVGEVGGGWVLACAEHLAEPPEVTAARKVLAASKAASLSGDPADPARWWGRLEAALELLLAHIDDEGWRPTVPTESDEGEGGPDLAPLIVAAPTEPPAGDTEGLPVYPAPGSAIPGMPGFVVAECRHRVAASEWRAGFRTCERCHFGGQDDADPDGGCVAEFIDGSWTYADCDCIECRTRLAEDPASGEEL